MPGELRIALGEAAPACRPKHRQQLMVAAGLARTIAMLQLAAARAKRLQHALRLRTGKAFCGIEPGAVWTAGEPGVVDLVELGGKLVRALRQARQPARGVALAALHERQV